MYAVVKTGGKQYRVAVGDYLKVERMKADIGESVSLDQVLMIADGDQINVGSPLLDSRVSATVVAHGRGEKLRIVKFRRRQNSRTRTGHRQDYTEIKIDAISGQSNAKSVTKTKTEAKSKVEKVEKAAVDSTEASLADLTQLTGVGPALAKKLGDAGIESLQQVAELDADGIAAIEEKAGLSGRFEKEGWVDQAKSLIS